VQQHVAGVVVERHGKCQMREGTRQIVRQERSSCAEPAGSTVMKDRTTPVACHTPVPARSLPRSIATPPHL